MLFSRAWEIIVGVMLGLSNLNNLKIKPYYSSLIATLGLTLIFFPAYFFLIQLFTLHLSQFYQLSDVH